MRGGAFDQSKQTEKLFFQSLVTFVLAELSSVCRFTQKQLAMENRYISSSNFSVQSMLDSTFVNSIPSSDMPHATALKALPKPSGSASARGQKAPASKESQQIPTAVGEAPRLLLLGGFDKAHLALRWRSRVRKEFDANYPKHLLLSNYYLRSVDSARDIVCEVFADALIEWRFERFIGIRNLHGYLKRAVRNSSLNAITRDSRFIEKKPEQIIENALYENTMSKLDFDFDLEALFKELPERQAEAFRLLLAGYSHKEISEKMDTTIGASKTLVYNARQKLIELWSELFDFDPDDDGGGKFSKGKKKLRNNKRKSIPEPVFDDVLRYAESRDKFDKHHKLRITESIETEEYSLEIAIGLLYAIEDLGYEALKDYLRKSKDELRKKLFGFFSDKGVWKQGRLATQYLNFGFNTPSEDSMKTYSLKCTYLLDYRSEPRLLYSESRSTFERQLGFLNYILPDFYSTNTLYNSDVSPKHRAAGRLLCRPVCKNQVKAWMTDNDAASSELRMSDLCEQVIIRPQKTPCRVVFRSTTKLTFSSMSNITKIAPYAYLAKRNTSSGTVFDLYLLVPVDARTTVNLENVQPVKGPGDRIFISYASSSTEFMEALSQYQFRHWEIDSEGTYVDIQIQGNGDENLTTVMAFEDADSESAEPTSAAPDHCTFAPYLFVGMELADDHLYLRPSSIVLFEGSAGAESQSLTFSGGTSLYTLTPGEGGALITSPESFTVNQDIRHEISVPPYIFEGIIDELTAAPKPIRKGKTRKMWPAAPRPLPVDNENSTTANQAETTSANI